MAAKTRSDRIVFSEGVEDRTFSSVALFRFRAFAMPEPEKATDFAM
jgi:hypothetical protein